MSNEIIRPQTHKLQTDLKFINTAEFSKSAAYFLNHGVYTKAPQGTKDWKEFWEEEHRRCVEGYTVGGTTITGLHYRYLNYVQIKASEENIATNKRKSKTKKLGFPRFLDMDYFFFKELEAARQEGEGMIVAKARRKGFSYKAAAMNEWEFNSVPASMCIIGAFEDTYCQSTMDMVLEMLNFINEHAPRWRKLRTKVNLRDRIRASYVEKLPSGIEVEKGFKSEILTLSFLNNPSKGIGKTANIFNFEEAGKWPDLKKAFGLVRDTFYDGDVAVGMPVIWGTGGDMESGSVDFADMFYNPHLFGLRAYDNIWDEDVGDGFCGYFVDDTWYREPYVDKDGNSDRQTAKESVIKQRELLRNSGKRKEYETLLTQRPLTPAEAFLQTTGNVFPVALLAEQMQKILTNSELRNIGQRGKLEFSSGSGVIWVPDPSLEEAPWPFSEDKKEGCIVIYEHPEEKERTVTDGEGKEVTKHIDLPYGLYIGGLDVYSQDQAADSTSYGSIFIYKKFWKASKTGNVIVAEYTGRPATMDEYYENCRKLLLYYNGCRVLYENMFTDVRTHFRNKSMEYLLLDQPSIIKNMSPNTKVQRGKGMHMTPAIKRAGEEYIRKWLLEMIDPETNTRNLNTIYSQWLLKELIAYNPKYGNYDRVMSFMMTMFHIEELENLELQEIEYTKEQNMFDNFFKVWEK